MSSPNTGPRRLVRRSRNHVQRPRLERMEDRCLLTSPPLVVTTTADSGAGSLRAAISQADTQSSAVIDFQIGSGGLQTIHLLSALPALTVPITIDGTSQPQSNGSAAIELDGTTAGAGVNGLVVNGGGSLIKGLIIDNFGGSGISINSAGGNAVQGCYLGVDPTGGAAAGNGGQGIMIQGAGNNTIGGLGAGLGNLISGNHGHGVEITGGALGNVIEGNYIGVDQTGTHSLPNAFFGVIVVNGQATIGGTANGARNIISSNGQDGVGLNNADHSVIEGNYIGTDLGGEKGLGNAGNGITAISSNFLQIGGSIAGARNVISANNGDGVLLSTSSSVVQGNFIGVDAAGSRSLGNIGDGIFFANSLNVSIGGLSAGTGNVISANGQNGINLLGVINNTGGAAFPPSLPGGNVGDMIQGNFIGTDSTGANALGNGANGINVYFGSSNLIGGPGGGNLISGNHQNGIFLGGLGNVLQANTIGTDYFGDHSLANSGSGVVVGGPENLVGGLGTGMGNLISGNNLQGLLINGPGAGFPRGVGGDQVFGNIIGTDRTSSFAVPNGQNGVVVNSSNVVIGQSANGAGNLIAGNHNSGMVLNAATNVYVIGNSIGTASGFSPNGVGAPIPNGSDGITVSNSSHVQIGGLYNGMPNTIADNGAKGISVVGSSADVAILSNLINNNAQLGIDIGNNGISPNSNQNSANYPVLLSAQNPSSGGNTIVSGSINSASNASVLIQFFSNPAADPSGHGQAGVAVGSVTVQTNSSGNATFSVALSQLVAQGQSISALATSGMGATSSGSTTPNFGTTSEFSNDVTVTPGPQPADLSLTLTQSTNFPAINGSLVYTLVVSNAGPGVATNVVLADNFPITSIAIGATTSQGTASLAANTLTFHLGAIASGATATATVIVSPKQSGTFNDTATVITDVPDPNLSNNSAAVAYSAAPSPTVRSVVLQAFRGDLTSVVVTFSAPMEITRASNPFNYAFYLPNAQGAFVNPLLPSSATYQASTNSVILIPSRLIPVPTFFQLSLNGLSQSTGLTDPGGRLLDGDANGYPGGNYESIVGIGQQLVYNDALANRVRLSLTGGGYLDLTRRLNGNAALLQVVGASSGVLSGQVVGGSTPLPELIVPAGVSVQLADPPFLLGGVRTQSFGNIAAAAFDRLSTQNGLPSPSRKHKQHS